MPETETEELTLDDASYYKMLDSINNSYTFERGTIDISNGLATLRVPNGFKYLNATQSHQVLTDVWGNPPEETLGMLFPENSE